MGAGVRYDGGHKRDLFVAETLTPFVEWVSVCPEVEAGLGTPRPAMQLRRSGPGAEPRLVEARSGVDHTDRMKAFSRRRIRALGDADLSGYILKNRSPSCGMERVKLYGEGRPLRTGRGLFAEALIQEFPLLPVEEEGRLRDPGLRSNFIERIFAYHRLKALLTLRFSRRAVVAFHTAHKLQLRAHSPQHYRELGRLVADIQDLRADEFRRAYASLFMETLTRKSSRGRLTDALQHAAGYLKTLVGSESRAELAETIEDFRVGTLPLVVPIALLRNHVRVHQIAYLEGQTLLDPHPKELMLLNHV